MALYQFSILSIFNDKFVQSVVFIFGLCTDPVARTKSQGVLKPKVTLNLLKVVWGKCRKIIGKN